MKKRASRKSKTASIMDTPPTHSSAPPKKLKKAVVTPSPTTDSPAAVTPSPTTDSPNRKSSSKGKTPAAAVTPSPITDSPPKKKRASRKSKTASIMDTSPTHSSAPPKKRKKAVVTPSPTTDSPAAVRPLPTTDSPNRKSSSKRKKRASRKSKTASIMDTSPTHSSAPPKKRKKAVVIPSPTTDSPNRKSSNKKRKRPAPSPTTDSPPKKRKTSSKNQNRNTAAATASSCISPAGLKPLSSISEVNAENRKNDEEMIKQRIPEGRFDDPIRRSTAADDKIKQEPRLLFEKISDQIDSLSHIHKPVIEDMEIKTVTGQETDRDEKTPLDSAEQEKKTTMSRKMEVPNNKVGDLIGKAGVTIIQIKSDPEVDPRLIGSLESIEKAEKSINDIISEFDAEGALAQLAAIAKQVQMYLPIDKDKELNENDQKMVSKLAQLQAIYNQFQMYLSTDQDKELNENDLKMVCKLGETALHLTGRLLEASVDLPNKVIVEGRFEDPIRRSTAADDKIKQEAGLLFEKICNQIDSCSHIHKPVIEDMEIKTVPRDATTGRGKRKMHRRDALQ